MAGQPPNPATLPHANIPSTPRSSSIADDSDEEFEPTPIHSPGGPQYHDLPPSYDEAQHQAVTDARNGIAPLDPNQLEAHRLTLNEGPNEPEIWEYRVRDEPPDAVNEQELAPEYESHASHLGSTVPVQHVGGSDNIPVGRVGSRGAPSAPSPDPTAALLGTALSFTRHEPDADVQYAPRLTRSIAIPQEGLSGRRRALNAGSYSSEEPVQFLRAYAKTLHAHSIRPAEFTEFLDGLNALCRATNTTAADLLHERPSPDALSSIVHDYIRGANEAFFAPRGLNVSLQSLSTVAEALSIPTERGQRAGALASVFDPASTADRRAQALHPWIEALETDVPSPSTRTLMLREMGDRVRGQSHSQKDSPKYAANEILSEKLRNLTTEDHADPPHSIPEPTEAIPNYGPWGTGRRGYGRRGDHQRGGPWTPFGAPGRGPFGAPGNGPFGAPGNGPFGRSGRGPFGPPSFGSGRGRAGSRSNGPGSPQSANEWTAWGENLGKLGEEFGKRMGDWGQQFGKRAEAWGQDVGRRAEVWGGDAYTRASGSGIQSRSGPGPADAETHNDPPPSYPKGPAGQETGVLRGESNADVGTPISTKKDGKKKAKDVDDDDEASSMSSDSSDSDSDSDSEDEDYPDTEAIFLKRIHSINEQADLAAKKGKKSPEEVARERALAIEEAQNEKAALDVKIEEKQTKRAIKLSLRQSGRELKKQYRQKKRQLRDGHVGKGKGKAKKSREWREAKKEYRDSKKRLRKEKSNAKKEWHEARSDRRRMNRKAAVGGGSHEEEMSGMVWVVVENWS